MISRAATADGTVIWTAPSGLTYTTHPGSRLLFPSLCRPTAPVHITGDIPTPDPSRGLKMPRRTRTRAQNRAHHIDAERARNRELRQIAETSQTSDTSCTDGENPYFPTRPPPPDDDDPPPF